MQLSVKLSLFTGACKRKRDDDVEDLRESCRTGEISVRKRSWAFQRPDSSQTKVVIEDFTGNKKHDNKQQA
jgi:hypothetical protein